LQRPSFHVHDPVAVGGACVVAAAVAGCAVAIFSIFGEVTPLIGVLISIAVAATVILANVAVRNPKVASALLLAMSFVCMRPMLFGERYSAISIVFAFAALLCATATGRHAPERSSGSVLLWVSLLWSWNLLLTLRPGSSPDITLRGIVVVPLVVFAAWVVISEQSRRTLVVKLIVGMVLATCASLLITFVLWELNGFESFRLGTIPGGYKQDLLGAALPGTPLYAPFTTTYGEVLVGTSIVPRFLGIGRESGIMGAVIAWCFFMLPRIGWSRLEWKLVLVLGLAATQSTAGFGTFLFVFVLTKFLIGQPTVSPSLTVLREFVGLGALVGAAYLAIYAPVLGVLFKFDSNAASVNGRLLSAYAGLRAIVQYPLGQPSAVFTNPDAGVNIVAAILVTGVPGLVFSVGAFVRPFLLSRRWRAALGPTAVLFITCLTSQPLIESTAFFVLVMLGSSSYALDTWAQTSERITSSFNDQQARNGEPVEILTGSTPMERGRVVN
jgi:hypothetical protein